MNFIWIRVFDDQRSGRAKGIKKKETEMKIEPGPGARAPNSGIKIKTTKVSAC